MIYTGYTPEFLSAKRLEGDTLADSFIRDHFANTEQKKALYLWLKGLSNNRQLNGVTDAYAGSALVNDASKLPIWANRKLMQNGADFFARHAQVIMNLLGLLSLPYCYAGANGAMVLYLSDRIKADTAKRLTETAEFVWDVMAPNAFEPDGKGMVSCLKIRLMHAAARFYTYQSEQWNNDWGTPVNQEDMAGTNLSFSLLVIRGLRKFGYAISYADQQAFMHLWNVIGFMLGMDENLLPADGKQANQLEEAIRLHQFKPSAAGQELTASLVHYFSSVNAGNYFSTDDVVQIMRYLLGNEVADMLNLSLSPISFVKLRLLKAVNLLSEIKVPENTRTAYHNEYKKFKQAQPA